MQPSISGDQGATAGVIGAGAWGTAIGKVLADKGHPVSLWSHENEVAAEVNGKHTNERFLPGIPLPAGLNASTDIGAGQ